MSRPGLLAFLLLAACAQPAVDPPSLLPRPGEIGIGEEPEPRPIALAPLPDAVRTQLEAAVAQARVGDLGFERAAAANTATITRGRRAATGSEPWLAAQTALSAVEAARGPAVDALATLDRLIADTVGSAVEIAPLEAAQRTVAETVERQLARLETLSR